MIFRRPELEKDNPIAPQPYIGPRRRLALARAAASAGSTEFHDISEMLQILTKAASRYVNNLPSARRTEKSLKVLREAIAQAERMLSVEGASSSSGKSHSQFIALSTTRGNLFRTRGMKRLEANRRLESPDGLRDFL